MRGIGFSGFSLGGAHADEVKIGRLRLLAMRGLKGEETGGQDLCEGLVEARFMEGDFALL